MIEFAARHDIPYNFTGKCKTKDRQVIRHYLNGALHRTDGPAVEYEDGYKEWRVEGKLHRLDGPSIEVPSGSRYYHVQGTMYTEEEFSALTEVIMYKAGLSVFI